MSHILGITWGVMPGAIDLISKKHNKSEVPQFFSFFSRVCSGEALQESWEFSFRGTFAKRVAHFHEANIPKLHTWLIQGKWMKKKRKRRSAFCFFFPGDQVTGVEVWTHATASTWISSGCWLWCSGHLWSWWGWDEMGKEGETWEGEYQLGQNLWRINTLWKCWGIFSKWTCNSSEWKWRGDSWGDWGHDPNLSPKPLEQTELGRRSCCFGPT